MSTQIILARTLWGEARGEGYEGMLAVGCTIVNRATNPRWWGHDITSVCQHRSKTGIYQFSCWSPHDPNYRQLGQAGAAYTDALAIADDLISGTVYDVTNRADHYANLHLCDPSWADRTKISAVIGNHTFFRLEI